MKTAILTGASSGLGREFARYIKAEFPEIDCVWLVARRAEKMKEIAEGMAVKCEIISADLTDTATLDSFKERLDSENPDIALLINCAGCGYLGDFDSSDPGEQIAMTDLNVRALTFITRAALPHMQSGAKIINISSIASFVPTPRMTVYSSTKAYVSSFSRGLRDELKPRKINVTYVCPSPMATEFIEVGRIAGKSKAFKTLPYCKPDMVAQRSLRAAKKNHAVYTPRLLYKFYRVLSSVVPNAIFVKFTRT